MFRRACASLLFALAWSALPAAAAEGYPQKTIRFILPFAPGGGTDVLARTLSARIEQALGVGVVIDNRAGAGGTLGTAMAARAAPDGYTFLFTSASFVFNPSLYKDLPFDPIKDFKPITMFGSSPHLLTVHPSMPVRSVKQLLALARKRPGEIHFSSGGVGSNIHLTTELFVHMAKVKLTHVPYKGGGPAQTALASGEVQMMLPGFQPALPLVKAGRIRALAVSTKQRSPVLPELPTVDESGVPGYDKSAWYALFAPAAVPEPIIAHVYRTVVKVLKDPDVGKRLASEGAVPGGQPPEEFAGFIRSEIAAWRKLIAMMKL